MIKPVIGAQSLPTPHITPYGDSALYLAFPSEGYDEEVTSAVLSLAAHLRASGKWEDVSSGYDSLVASFDPIRLSLTAATKLLTREAAKAAKTKPADAAQIIDVPVYYGGENGPDINVIIKSSGLTQEGVIKQHSAQPYRVCMMGFVPGFTFLSEVPKALRHPRRPAPRLSVPAGSIGIAGWQTGLYGLSSPGGWQIIGRTPLRLFDGKRAAPFLWQAGDKLRFVPQSGPFPIEQSS